MRSHRNVEELQDELMAELESLENRADNIRSKLAYLAEVAVEGTTGSSKDFPGELRKMDRAHGGERRRRAWHERLLKR